MNGFIGALAAQLAPQPVLPAADGIASRPRMPSADGAVPRDRAPHRQTAHTNAPPATGGSCTPMPPCAQRADRQCRPAAGSPAPQ